MRKTWLVLILASAQFQPLLWGQPSVSRGKVRVSRLQAPSVPDSFGPTVDLLSKLSHRPGLDVSERLLRSLNLGREKPDFSFLSRPAEDSSERSRSLDRLKRTLGRESQDWAELESGGGRSRELVRFLESLVSPDSVQEQADLKNVLERHRMLEDAFDRGADHSSFLRHTSQLQKDKARLMDYAVGPTVLEVGPGGGTNLFHLEKRRREDPGIQRILALESSARTVPVLRKYRDAGMLSAEIIQGNALNLKNALRKAGVRQVHTILYSSVLHEVFSYAPYQGRLYNLNSVSAVLKESLELLAPGGRLLIRDTVAPEDGEKNQILELRGAGAREAFFWFARNFKARRISFKPAPARPGAGNSAFSMKRKDVSEFIYKLSWGARAFPYEAQEQYGYSTYGGFLKLLKAAASEASAPIRLLPVPQYPGPYLQSGYRKFLDSFVSLRETDANPSSWPSSNMMLAVQKEKP